MTSLREHQLHAYLADQFEEKIYALNIEKRSLPAIPLPENLPLHLISNRPDITAQLWLIESASYQIKSAKAAFYPDFNLAAFFGYQTIFLKKLFTGRSTFYNIDPAVSLPIMDGGRLRANLRISKSDYDLAVYEYSNMILNAVKEVMDGLSVLRSGDSQLQELRGVRIEQEKLLNLSLLREKNHLDSKLDSLIREANALAAQDQEIAALGYTLQAELLLIKALGGGFDICN